MDIALQPTEEHQELGQLLGRAQAFILQLLGLIEGVIHRLDGAPIGAALVAALMRRWLLPAEAALRRAILLIAHTLPLVVLAPHAPSRAAGALPRCDGAKGTRPARAPVFRMSEAQPRPKAAAGYLPEHQLPRITLLVDSALHARSAPAAPAAPLRDPAEVFWRRLAAFNAAFDNPVAAANRWLRRRAANPAIAARVLAPVRIPGATRRIGKENLVFLRELTAFARRTLTPDTS